MAGFPLVNRLRSSISASLLPALWLCTTATACGDPADDIGPQAATEGDPGSESSGGESSSGGQSSSGDDTSSSTEASSSGDGPAESSSGEVEPGPPGEIGLDRVTLNQGTGVTIAEAGAFLRLSTDAPRLVAGRPMLMRATWSLSEDWVGREVEGRLVLRQPDGSEETLIDTMMVEGEADLEDLGGAFRWSLTSEQMQSGAEVRIEFVDLSAADETPVSSLPPDGGLVQLPIPDATLSMHVVLVPIAYDDGAGCKTVGDTSAATVDAMHDALLQQNPLASLTFEVHEPISVVGPDDNLTEGLMQLVAARTSDGAAPQAFYYGVVDNCDPDPSPTGRAYGIPSDPTAPSAAFDRTAIGVWEGIELTAQTFVHEMGHCQGRYHVLCPDAVSAGADPGYPDHPNGTIVERGYGIVDGQLRDASLHDYMTYCPDQWVGAYGWNIAHATQVALAEAYGALEGPPPPGDDVLLGMISPSGYERWIVVPGPAGFAAEVAESTIELRLGGETLTQPGTAHRIADGDDVVVMAALPPGGIEAAELRELRLAAVLR